MALARSDTDDGRNLLILDGVAGGGNWLGGFFSRRGFEVVVENDAVTALKVARSAQPSYVVLDLEFPDPARLRLVARMKAAARSAQVIVLTSYASVASAVAAMKMGATDYLPKPVAAEEVLAAFERDGLAAPEAAPRPMSVDRLVWEHVNRIFLKHDGNTSATARALSMHRRTLQRMLRKHAARN